MEATTTMPDQKKSVWVTVLWVQYLILLLYALASLLVFTIGTINVTGNGAIPKDMLTYGLVGAAVYLALFAFLFFLTSKKKKMALVAVPTIELVFILAKMYGMVVLLHAQNVTGAWLLYALGYSFFRHSLRPLIAIYILYKNKLEFSH